MKNDQTPNIKITMLGYTGAGKTCFMLGMYATMRLGVKGFTFTTSNMDDDLELSNAWDQMVERHDKERWPRSTPQTRYYPFEFRYALSEKLLGFDWIDYRGGALRDTATKEDVQELMNHLQESECVFLCISGEHLRESIEDREQSVQRAAGIDGMLRLLQRLPQNVRPTVVIVITKYDVVPEGRRRQEVLIEEIKQLFNPFFAAGGRWLTMICPVTLGKELSSSRDKGEIDPRHIHLPVTFSAYYALKNEADRIQGLHQEADKFLKETDNWLGRLFDRSAIAANRVQLAQQAELLKEIEQRMKLVVRELMKSVSIFYQGKEVVLDE